MPYYPRVIETTVARYLKLFPVVGLTGPRQSGKSTMLRRLLGARYRYVSFDDLNVVDQFHTDPEQFMSVYANMVIFDEVHTRSDADLFFFRESNGNEIDLIIDRKGKQDYMEIKVGHTYRPEMARALARLGGEATRTYIVSRGREIEGDAKLRLVNYRSFLGEKGE